MAQVRIVTDSTADLTRDLIERHRITVVPLLVQFEEEVYRDGVDIDTDRLFAKVAEKKRLPKTAAVGPGVFQETFAQTTAGGAEVVYVGISSKLSSTLQNARMAAEEFEGRVRIWDSLNLSTGVGYQVLLAAEMAGAGKSPEEILAALEDARPKIRTYFVIDTLDYLYMGGRCSGLQMLVGSLLKIRPVIAVVDGGMIVAAKLRGPRQKALDWMLERFAEDARQVGVDPTRVFITHTGVPDNARYMADAVRRTLPEVREILETRAGAVIGSHCGPGTIGIIYKTK
ncbi:MAG: DegV family protein [Bacillota bacterium]|nr:MAG: fatty acid-binding protein DegV [Bacillota bacterium]